MAEMVRVPGVLGLTDGVGEAVIGTLVTEHKLPADFQFRLLALDPYAEKMWPLTMC